MIFRKCVLFRPMLPLRHTDGGHLKEFVQRTLSFPFVNEGWPPEAVERPARANGGEAMCVRCVSPSTAAGMAIEQ
jgi:hypothetical protein